MISKRDCNVYYFGYDIFFNRVIIFINNSEEFTTPVNDWISRASWKPMFKKMSQYSVLDIDFLKL